MKFGINVSSDDPWDSDPIQRVQECLERVHLARDLGFDSVFVAHRYSIGPAKGLGVLETCRFMPLLTLARLAPETGNMLLGTSVFLFTLHNPVEIAEEIATLDAFCGGRLRFGIGLGWLPYEFESFGIPASEKVSRFEESLQVVKRLWTEDEVSFEGKHYRFDGVRMNARPLQKPYPPIWIGASGDRAVRRAARLADSWVISGHIPISELRRQLPMYKQTLADQGKPFPMELPAIRLMYTAKDRETAIKDATPQLQKFYKDRGQWGWWLMQAGEMERYWHEEQPEWIVGDPEDCIQQIAECRELGITHLIVGPSWPGVTHTKWMENLRLIGEKVMPYFKKNQG